MNDSRTRILFGVLFAAVAIAVVVFFLNTKPSKPAPSASGYYSGPFRNKSNPNMYGNDDGQQVAAPADSTPAAAGAKAGPQTKDL
jgi:hypothetical protein